MAGGGASGGGAAYGGPGGNNASSSYGDSGSGMGGPAGGARGAVPAQLHPSQGRRGSPCGGTQVTGGGPNPAGGGRRRHGGWAVQRAAGRGARLPARGAVPAAPAMAGKRPRGPLRPRPGSDGRPGVYDETRMQTATTPLARARMRAQGVMGQLKRLLTNQAAGFDDTRPNQASPQLAQAMASVERAEETSAERTCWRMRRARSTARRRWTRPWASCASAPASSRRPPPPPPKKRRLKSWP
jgi:hypothetical protein